MRPSELAEVLPGLMDAGQPTFVWGPPGVCKSSIVAQVAAKAGRGLVDVRAVLLDPVDLRGIPHISDDGKAHWCPPDFLPSDPDSTAVVFLDELAQAAPLVQSACLQLTLDRRIGEYTLPKGCTIIAASNRREDRAGAHRLITPLLNRFLHLTVEVNNEDWRAWAMANQIDPRIMAFMAFKPDMLFQFEPSSADTSFPTPRSWEFVSHVLKRTPPRLLFPVVEGCVGKGAAGEFCAFVKMYDQLPDVDEVLKNPGTHEVPTEPSVVYAVCGALAEKLRTDPTLADAYVEFVTRIVPEFAVLAMRDGMEIVPLLHKSPKGAAWLRDNRDLLLGDDPD